jgi:CRISPR-associated protein Csd1
MLMQELRRLAATPEVAAGQAPEGYASRRVKQVIQLAKDGRCLGVVDLTQTGPGGVRGTPLLVPSVIRASAIRPLLLADGSDYLFGIASGTTRPERAARCRDAFLALTTDCANATGLSQVRAVETFLRSGVVPSRLDPAADIVTFAVEGELVVDLLEVQRFWRELQTPAEATESMECLVCGRTAPAAGVWPVPVKGIPGGQTSGNQLVSANEHAFESYGLARSRTSPACVDCAADAGRALNWLLERDGHHLRLPNSVLVFWTRGETDFDPLTLLMQPEPAAVEALLRTPFTARTGALQLEQDRFYAVELAASGARVAVRTWIDRSVPEVRDHLAQYFRRQTVIRHDGAESRPMSIRELLRGTVRELKELDSQLTHDLIEAAVDGRPVTARLLIAVVRRNRAERRVTTARAALTKMALFNRPVREHEELWMTRLDPQERDAAYLCGRLLAELEAAQRAALGRLNQTLTDRFYGGASTSPASVFPALLRNLRNHMAKLRRDRPTAYHTIEGRLMDITSGLPPRLPAALTLEQQARFGIGYYHQRAEDRAAARAARERGTRLAEELGDTEGDGE